MIQIKNVVPLPILRLKLSNTCTFEKEISPRKSNFYEEEIEKRRYVQEVTEK